MGHAVRFRFAVVACLGVLALAGCGRRGPLELPDSPTPTPQAADALANEQNRTLQEPPLPGLIQSPTQVYQQPASAKLNLEHGNPPPPINEPEAPKRSSFPLDSLL